MKFTPFLPLLFLGSLLLPITTPADPGNNHQQPAPAPAPAEDNWQSRVDAPTTLEAIKLFRKDPTSKDALSALAIVMAFAELSDKVVVVIRKDHLPWIDEQAVSEQAKALLTGAFVAGNIEAQLQNNTKINRPYEGIRMALFTYHEMRAKNMAPKLAILERWTGLDKKGELKETVENMPPPSQPGRTSEK